MIRIRKSDGEIQEVEEAFQFIELCDSDGNPCLVAFKDGGGRISILTRGTAQAELYEKGFDVKFVPIKEKPEIGK